MNIYENVATQAIVTFFYYEPLWKKQILFDFLLKPFKLELKNIQEVIFQDKLKNTIPDFTIITDKNQRIRFEVKINDAILTNSECSKNTRDAFLICKNYYSRKEVEELVGKNKTLFWEDLFETIDKQGATNNFARLNLVREYINDPLHTIQFNPNEVATFYSPETICAVYNMSEKIRKICNNFFKNKSYNDITENDDRFGIGCFFKAFKKDLFIGLSPSVRENKYYFSIALKVSKEPSDSFAKNIESQGGYMEFSDESWAYFPLDKTIFIKNSTDTDLQKEFNKNAESVLKKIKSIR